MIHLYVIRFVNFDFYTITSLKLIQSKHSDIKKSRYLFTNWSLILLVLLKWKYFNTSKIQFLNWFYFTIYYFFSNSSFLYFLSGKRILYINFSSFFFPYYYCFSFNLFNYTWHIQNFKLYFSKTNYPISKKYFKISPLYSKF